MSSRNALAEVLHSTSIKSLISEKNSLVVVSPDDSLENCVKKITDNKILSLPVIKHGVCLGVVDMCDIANYILASCPEAPTAHSLDVGQLKVAGRIISLAPVKNVLRTARKSPMLALHEASTALELAQLLSQGHHRAVIFSFQMENIEAILSQIDLARFILDHLPREHCKALGSKSLRDLGYGECQVFTLRETATVYAAIQKLAQTGVSSLAIVDSHGKLVGNFSASDLRNLYFKDYPHLTQTVHEYLEAYNPSSLEIAYGDAKASLVENLRKLVAGGCSLHHLWMVDENNVPIGIFSLTDVLSIACHSTE